MSTLPISDISGLAYDPDLKRIIVTSWASSWVLGINPVDRTCKFWDAGWRVRHVAHPAVACWPRRCTTES